jgi:serine/threonine-protein kinase
LRHTSRNGVVHRDIKPSNIIVTATGRAKLVDLGLAKRDSTEPGNDLTVAGTTLGTFDYISPEQARDPRSVDVRSDLYSLGCTMYHLLTGEPPYPAGTVLQKLLDHQAQDTPDVLSKNRHVPPALSALIRKLMASDPKRRYANPEELLRDLAVIARGLGLRVISSDSATLVPEARLKGLWWEQNFGWMVTAAALVLIVATLQAVPGLWDQLTAWTVRFSAVPAQSETALPQPIETTDSTTSAASTTPAHAPSRAEHPDKPKIVSQAAPSPPVTAENLTSPAESIENTTGRVEAKPTAGATPTDMPTIPEPTTPPASAVSAAKPAEATAPAISIIGSDVSFPTLEQACAEAKDGQVIELRFDGPRSVADRTLRLTNKRLTIRGAQGYRPLLELSDAARSADPSVTRWIAVTGGSLQLVNLDLAARIHASPTGAPWVLFSLERPEQLQLDRVTVTIANPRRRQASVIEFGSAAAASAMVKSGPPPEIQLSKCVVRGAAALITVREAISARFAIEDSLITLDESLLQISGRPSMNAGDVGQIKFDLVHNTIILGGSLIVSRQDENLSDRQLPLFVTAKNNLISVGREIPLVDLSGSGDAMEIRDSFVWSGERNGYDDIRAFWVIRSLQNVNPPLDFHAWRELWGGEASGSWNGPIRWRQSVRQLALQHFLPEQAALEPNPAINPAISGAADGTDLGAPLDELPVPPQPPFERVAP